MSFYHFLKWLLMSLRVQNWDKKLLNILLFTFVRYNFLKFSYSLCIYLISSVIAKCISCIYVISNWDPAKKWPLVYGVHPYKMAIFKRSIIYCKCSTPYVGWTCFNIPCVFPMLLVTTMCKIMEWLQLWPTLWQNTCLRMMKCLKMVHQLRGSNLQWNL